MAFNLSGIGSIASRATQTLGKFGKAYNIADLKDDIDLKREELQKLNEDAIDVASNVPFANEYDTLENQYADLSNYLVDNVTADDFGGYQNMGGVALEGLLGGASSAAGTMNPLAMGISAAADSAVNISSASRRNARLGKKDWFTEHVGGYTPFTVGIGGLFGLPPIVGEAVIGGIGKKLGWNNDNEENIVDKTNREIANTNRQISNIFNRNYATAASNIGKQRSDFLLNQYAANGGFLETNGSTWGTGVNFINNGGTHQENPFGGVQYGIASDGMPNLVEEDEVVIKVRNTPSQGHSFAEGGSPTYSDYVVSDREYPTLEEIADANITKKPEQYVGKSWAKIYKDLFDKSHIKEVINRQDSKDYIDSFNERVAKAHETTRLRNYQKDVMSKLKKATPEQQDLILQQAGYPNLIEEAAYAAHGGKIYIKPSKRGTFTAAATKHGMGVQEFASKVLANKEDYSPAMVKKANFARNFGGHKHAGGGYIPYDNSKGFEFFVDNDYTQDYKDWLNSRDWTGADKPVFDRLSTIYKQYTGKTLTPQKATLLGKDKMFGPFHQAYGDEFRRYNNSNVSVTDNNGTQPDPAEGIKRIEVSDINEDNTPPIIILPKETPEGTLYTGPSREGFDWSFSNDSNKEITNPNTNQDLEVDTNVYPTPVIKHEPVIKNIGTDVIENDDTYTEGLGTDWVLPAISGASVLSDLFGLTNRPDYSNADRIGRAILSPRYIGYRPTGRYVKPQLIDTNYLASRLGNQNMAAISAAQNLSSANSANASAVMAAQNYLGQQAVGDAIAKGQIENNKAIQDAVQINNAVDRANAEGALQADKANQAAWDNYIGRYAAQKTAEAKLREDIDNQVATNRSANWNNFLENMQAYFDNQRNRNMANSAYRGTGYWIDRSGDIHYTTKNPSAKTKKEAESKSKEVIDNNKTKNNR